MKRLLLPFCLPLIAFVSICCDKDDGPTDSSEWTCGKSINYSGKNYNTVNIGNQCWLRENLDIGTMIRSNDTAKNDGVFEKYCYNDSIENCNIYGGLYKWDEAMQYVTTEGTQGICPDGWHIPTIAEYGILSNTVGANGNALKSVGQGTGIGAGTNTSGFSALLAGTLNNTGAFYYLNHIAFFWSSTEYDLLGAYGMDLEYNNVDLNVDHNTHKQYGFNIRCIKD